MLFINALVSEVDCQQGVDCQRSSPRSLQPAEWNGCHSRVPVLATIDRGVGVWTKSLATHGRKIDGVMSARPTMSADCSDGEADNLDTVAPFEEGQKRNVAFRPRSAPTLRYRFRKDGPGGNEHRRDNRADNETVQPKSRNAAKSGNQHYIIGHLGVLAHQNRA